jgi:hypothetical protein
MQMEIIRALEIAGREWGNIRSSLEMCGDIGEFDSENPINSRITETEDPRLVENLNDMENKVETYGYFTQEAAYVFSALGSSAAVSLGLVGGLSEAFGNGYSWVRTGWIEENVGKQQVIKHLFFMKIFFPKIFFPLGGYFNLDFNSCETKTKLKAVFNRFIAWQDNPKSYAEDILNCRDQIEPLLLGFFLPRDYFPYPMAIKNIKGGRR